MRVIFQYSLSLFFLVGLHFNACSQWFFGPSVQLNATEGKVMSEHHGVLGTEVLFQQRNLFMGALLHGTFGAHSSEQEQSRSEGSFHQFGAGLVLGYTPNPQIRKLKLVGFCRFNWSFGNQQEQHWWQAELMHRWEGPIQQLGVKMSAELWVPLGSRFWLRGEILGLEYSYTQLEGGFEGNTQNHAWNVQSLPFHLGLSVSVQLGKIKPSSQPPRLLPGQPRSAPPPGQPYSRFRPQ
jgi:hypothetical protein